MLEKRTLQTAAHEQHVVAVETPRGICKLFSVYFHADGSLFLLFPYFSRSDGFVSLVSREPRTGQLDYLSGGAITSHQVKFSYHPDGRVHFSQTGKIRTAIGKNSMPLSQLRGPAFVVRCQGLHAFQPLTERDRTRKLGRRIVVGAQLDRHVDAVTVMGHWHAKEDLLLRTSERTLGPLVQLRRKGGEIQTGALLGPKPYCPPQDRVLLLTCEETQRLPDRDSYLLLLGGFDAPFNFRESRAAFSFLLLAYPRGAIQAVHDLLPSLDL